MSEYIAVNNGTFEIEVTPVAPPNSVIATPNNGSATPVLPATFGINDCSFTEDNKCKAVGDKVIIDEITDTGILPTEGANDDFSCGPLSVSPYNFATPGKYTITAGSLKTACSAIPPMLENDSTLINCACAGTDSTTPTPIAFAGSCIVKISKAGQEKAKAE